MMSMAVNAEVIEYEDDSFKYNLDTEAKTAEVFYNGYATEVSIPESVTYNDVAYTVTRLGKYCFYLKNVASVTIPSSVTSLGERCFQYCRSLESITIPSSVTSIGALCFYDCGITSITIPSSVTSLGGSCIKDCQHLASMSVDVNNPVYDSRENCNAIIEKKTNTMLFGCINTVIPSSVTSLGGSCFSGCSFTSITIPSSVTSLGDNCFRDCSSLESITIPSSVTKIEYDCFSGCI